MITRKTLQPERRKTSLSPNGYAGNGTGEKARRQRARHTETEVEKQSDNSSGEAPPSWPNKPSHISPNPPRYICPSGIHPLTATRPGESWIAYQQFPRHAAKRVEELGAQEALPGLAGAAEDPDIL